MASIMPRGRTSSIAPMSFENLFKIRPDGFVSKKRIGARNTLENILLWRFFDARIQMLKKR